MLKAASLAMRECQSSANACWAPPRTSRMKLRNAASTWARARSSSGSSSALWSAPSKWIRSCRPSASITQAARVAQLEGQRAARLDAGFRGDQKGDAVRLARQAAHDARLLDAKAVRAELDIRGGHHLLDQLARLGVEFSRQPVQLLPVALARQQGVGRADAGVAVALGARMRHRPHRLAKIPRLQAFGFGRVRHRFIGLRGHAGFAQHTHIQRTNPMALPVPADER